MPNACTMFRSFYSKISSIIDKHIPVKQLSRREIKFKSKPWTTSTLRKSIVKLKTIIIRNSLRQNQPITTQNLSYTGIN